LPANLTKLRPYTLAPHPADEANVKLFFDWIQTSLNALIGQQVPPSTGFGAVNPPTLNPTTGQLVSAGARTGALATNFAASAPSTTSITIYWDGTNSSTVLRLYRDDGTVAGPFPGSQLVTGLVANTKYFFYPYFDEASQRVLFVSVAGAVGSPPVAYTSASIAVAQQQILRGRIPLASNLATAGFSTPAAGNTPAASQGGGGGGVGAHLGTGLTR
jgi:hypothetical protein